MSVSWIADQSLGRCSCDFHGIMKESDDLDHVVACHAIEHDMAWAFDRSMRVFGLAGVNR